MWLLTMQSLSPPAKPVQAAAAMMLMVPAQVPALLVLLVAAVARVLVLLQLLLVVLARVLALLQLVVVVVLLFHRSMASTTGSK